MKNELFEFKHALGFTAFVKLLVYKIIRFGTVLIS